MKKKNSKLEILGPNFFDSEKNQFKIGPDGLRLTVCTLKIKGSKSPYEMTEEEMNSERKIKAAKDVIIKRSQVFLGIRYDDQHMVSRYSKMIIDSKSVFDVCKYQLLQNV